MPFEMQKDIMYFRLSEEDEEDKRESNSISSQRACVEQYLHDRPELGSNFEEIVDDGYSGTSLDRPGMRRLLAMIKRNQVRTVIVRDLSRFARNYLEAGYYLEIEFPSRGVRFISVNDGFDSEELGEDTGGLDLAVVVDENEGVLDRLGTGTVDELAANDCILSGHGSALWIHIVGEAVLG